MKKSNKNTGTQTTNSINVVSFSGTVSNARSFNHKNGTGSSGMLTIEKHFESGKSFTFKIPFVTFDNEVENDDHIKIDGSMTQTSYTNKEGKKVYQLQVVCESVTELDSETLPFD